jgi:hypothetical protein
MQTGRDPMEGARPVRSWSAIRKETASRAQHHRGDRHGQRTSMRAEYAVGSNPD